MSNDQSLLSRLNALKCMTYGGAGTLSEIRRHFVQILFQRHDLSPFAIQETSPLE
jgi:hypothetical protein